MSFASSFLLLEEILLAEFLKRSGFCLETMKPFIPHWLCWGKLFQGLRNIHGNMVGIPT